MLSSDLVCFIAIVISLVVAVIAFSLVFVLFEKILNVLTAWVGGIMTMTALERLGASENVVIIVGIIVMVLGALFQIYRNKRHKRRDKHHESRDEDVIVLP